MSLPCGIVCPPSKTHNDIVPLAPGFRLGSHEIAAKLGEGGMGEVYRATDTRLRRSVAIKVLPTAFTADHDRLAPLRA